MHTQDAILSLRDAQLKAGHRVNTRKTYRHWLLRYISGVKDGHHSDLQGFLDDLSTRQRLNPKTIKQALNAMVFFYKRVLEQEPGKLSVPAINRNRNEPTWLHHSEVMDLLGRMRGTPKLQAAFLYATGSRINAMLTMRLKDVDLVGKTVTFQHDKGGKTRTVRLAESLIAPLSDHIEWLRGKWEQDNRSGITAHTFRHSHATALLQCGENIRVIQQQLGHSHVETTEIYSHATAQYRPISPLDRTVIPFVPAAINIPPQHAICNH